MQASSSFSLCRYVNRNYGIKEIKSRNCQNVYQCELEIGKYLFIAFWLLKPGNAVTISQQLIWCCIPALY